MRMLLTAGGVLALACACLSWTAPASADEQPANAELFAQLDANGDGLVAADEVGDEHQRLFKRLLRRSDDDGDGQLTAEEFAAGLAAKSDRAMTLGGGASKKEPTKARGAAFGKLDRDGDGKISADDVPEARRERFARWLERGDRDDDQMLSREEFAEATDLAMNEGPDGPRRRRPRGDEAPPEGPRGEEGPRRARGDAPGPVGFGAPPPNPILRALDKDGDGAISAEELSAAVESLKKLDRNGDGKLDRSELGPPTPHPWPRGPRGDGPPDRPGWPPRAHRPEGDGPEGRGPEARGPERRGFERRGPEGRGRGPEGRGPEGRGPEGRGPEGRGPEARGPERRGPEGRGFEGPSRERGPRGERPDGPPGDREDWPARTRRPGGGEGFGPPQERSKQIAERLFGADKDGDGKLSKDELPQRMQRAFERLDENKDGVIERREFHRHLEWMRSRMEGRPEGRPRGADRRRPDGPPRPRDASGPDREPVDDSAAAPEETAAPVVEPV